MRSAMVTGQPWFKGREHKPHLIAW
jgi:hypothetical protein